MQIWLSIAADYYYWPLIGDFLMGRVDPEVFTLGPDFYRSLHDSYGTHILFALFTLASNETALYSWPTLAITWLVWSGVTIQNMVRRVYGFGFWPSIFIALCVVCGSFYNYVVASGMMGQLVAMFCFLAALERILAWGDVLWPKLREQKELFIPIFLIFLAYQGGYLAFLATIAMVAAIIGFFKCH
ncbi:MAG: hypothetical protein LBF38_00775, partial [Deltaproteobacteria bacterium]|nr:hypothetical protein [Deltaproteobacteria bacterium]